MDTKEIMRRYDEQIKAKEVSDNIVGAVIASAGFGHLVDKSARARMRAISESIQKENKRKNLIRSNECPICSGKLTRGKRNKNKDYKREWVCDTCSAVHYI